MLTQQDMLDWLEELSMPLGNFIANGTVLFLSDKSNIEHYYQACSVAVNYAVRDLSLMRFAIEASHRSLVANVRRCSATCQTRWSCAPTAAW
jgi:hypothetical protein